MIFAPHVRSSGKWALPGSVDEFASRPRTLLQILSDHGLNLGAAALGMALLFATAEHLLAVHAHAPAALSATQIAPLRAPVERILVAEAPSASKPAAHVATGRSAELAVAERTHVTSPARFSAARTQTRMQLGAAGFEHAKAPSSTQSRISYARLGKSELQAVLIRPGGFKNRASLIDARPRVGSVTPRKPSGQGLRNASSHDPLRSAPRVALHVAPGIASHVAPRAALRVPPRAAVHVAPRAASTPARHHESNPPAHVALLFPTHAAFHKATAVLAATNAPPSVSEGAIIAPRPVAVRPLAPRLVTPRLVAPRLVAVGSGHIPASGAARTMPDVHWRIPAAPRSKVAYVAKGPSVAARPSHGRAITTGRTMPDVHWRIPIARAPKHQHRAGHMGRSTRLSKSARAKRAPRYDPQPALAKIPASTDGVNFVPTALPTVWPGRRH